MLIIIALQPVLVLLLIYFMNSVLRLALFAERPSSAEGLSPARRLMFLEYNSKVAYTQLLTPPFLSALVLDRRGKWAVVKSCSRRALACGR